jgi:glucosyl-3-phosphoglycerate synthase
LTSTWFAANTSSWQDLDCGSPWAKAAPVRPSSLVVPAHNEAATLRDVVSRVHEALMETTDLLDEIVVVDSDSTDTYAVATSRGRRTPVGGDPS